MTDATLGWIRSPRWVWAIAALGLAWNLFGIVQWYGFVTQTQAGLMMKGMTPSAAALYYGLPTWMKLAFAIGTFGGLCGSLALIVQRPAAIPVLAVSLAGYVALFAGDYAYGVFDAIPGQAAILSVVVAIALGLLSVAIQVRVPADRGGSASPNGQAR